jgi:hypothetical protein
MMGISWYANFTPELLIRKYIPKIGIHLQLLSAPLPGKQPFQGCLAVGAVFHRRYATI